MTRSGTGPVVVVLSDRLGAVLPVAAVKLIRDGSALYADGDVPAEWAAQCGALPAGEDGFGGGVGVMDGLLLTLDSRTGLASHWVGSGATVLRTPEPAGIALLDAVAVMDRLRSPGGCPWDAEQTHQSLMPYLVEEAYELYQALEDSDAGALCEELGDVLLQVLFHARVAAETPGGCDIDAVAGALVTKLVNRHPHVFAGGEEVSSAAEQQIRWEELKRVEKRRESSLDGVALAQPAAALAAKLVSRAARAGFPADLLPGTGGGTGASLFALSATAKLTGEDPEAALRGVARRFAADVRAAEASARAAGLPAGRLTAQQWREHWPR